MVVISVLCIFFDYFFTIYATARFYPAFSYIYRPCNKFFSALTLKKKFCTLFTTAYKFQRFAVFKLCSCNVNQFSHRYYSFLSKSSALSKIFPHTAKYRVSKPSNGSQSVEFFSIVQNPLSCHITCS